MLQKNNLENVIFININVKNGFYYKITFFFNISYIINYTLCIILIPKPKQR